MKNYVDAEKLQEYTTKLVAKLKEIFPGPAQAASTVAEMTDESKVYVYTGSETGYTAGNWYYWDGTAWTSGGVYNAVQIETDTTLTESGEAADAKATGDAIAAAKAAVLADLAPAYSTSATYAVGAYVVYNGGLYRCITAISTAEAWTAAHWTAVDLANDVGASLADLKSAISGERDIDMTASGYNSAISVESEWVGGSKYNCLILPVEDGDVGLKVTANNGANAVVAFLTTDAHTSGTAPDYVTGTGRTVVPPTESETFRIPEGTMYLYIQRKMSSTTSTPASAKIVYYKDIPDVDATLAISGDAADAKATGDAIERINGILIDDKAVDLSSGYNGYFINSSGVWSSNGQCKNVPLLGDALRVTVTANDDYNANIAFLTELNMGVNKTPKYCEGTTKSIILAGETRKYDVPSDANYLYIWRSYSDENHLPVSAYIGYSRTAEAEVIPLGLHEMPRDENALNIVRRARQLTDIRWTPAVDLPRLMVVQRAWDAPGTAEAQYYLGTFEAGKEYKGVPYGRVSQTTDSYGYEYGTVGHYIGFDAFVSSVSNPKSRLCVTDVSSVSSHKSLIYATVCSGLTCYCLDVAERASASIPGISGLSLIGVVNNDGTLLGDEQFQIGDVLNKYDFHTAIITDIIRASDGTIQSIEICDASVAGLSDRNYADGLTGGVCRRKGWTRDQLFESGSWGDYSLYRYTGTVTYTPSPYVNVGDEFDGWRIEHCPVMPYEGEGFVYKTGYIPNNAVKLVVTLDGYSYLKVFKDGVEISGSPFSVSAELDDITISEITAGEYKAYLCNISDGNVVNTVYPCHWSIVE